MASPFGFGNDDDLGDLNNLTGGEESEDENREDEIKQLLAEAFSNETFDDESEHSFAASEHSKMQDHTSNESSLHSYNGSTDRSSIAKNDNSGFSFVNNGHMTVLPNLNQVPHQFTNGRIMASTGTSGQNGIERTPIQVRASATALDNGGGGDSTDGSPIGIEENNKTVSIIHKTHCPQLINNGGGDNNGNDDNWTSTPINKMEQLQTMNGYRERQIARSEETIAVLSKDKRALNHQIGLMRTEMIQMQSSFSDAEKALKLKEEEVEFLKSKIQEAIVDYESLKRSEKDVKGENNRLVSQIGRLEQEVKLLSTIGTSTQQAEVDTIVRQIRDRHAQETIAFKTEVANLEAELRSYKRYSQYNEEKESETISTQTVEIEPDNARVKRDHEMQTSTPTRTNCTQTIYNGEDMQEMITKITALQQSSSISTQTVPPPRSVTVATQIEAKRITSGFTQTDALPIEVEKVLPATPKQTQMTATGTQTPSRSCMQSSTQTATSCAQMAQSSTQTPPPPAFENSASLNSSANTEVQTDETLQTYEVLNSLFEKWAAEVTDATKRAELAESQVQFTEVSLKKLRKKFKALYSMTSLCRQEWKRQEEFLKKRNEETKSRYLNVLVKMHQKFDRLDLVS